MNRKTEFQRLYGRLRLPAAEVAAIIGRQIGTVHQYVSDGARSRRPPEKVIAAMRAAWRERAHLQLGEIVRHLRDEGVAIDWFSLEESGSVERVFVKPAFLRRYT
ncbi:hypothetical protein [Microvirga splendida]|uniref:XRE family transcriptional regulator n=1 Tax=Microvirga splendida TaxID=2795727 RepID=A0ABS0XZ96_9HYPH|nr:hypothetical protein [Microvirga splendida]MBJ6125384.1 hypothetical protein [Microvirga splendida]